jgi:predicted RNase H-like HicB family nuclease
MNRYAVLIYWSRERDTFLAEVPELSGCIGEGGTYQAALTDAEKRIDEWVRNATAIGRDIPRPRGPLRVVI